MPFRPLSALFRFEPGIYWMSLCVLLLPLALLQPGGCQTEPPPTRKSANGQCSAAVSACVFAGSLVQTGLLGQNSVRM